jgi:hypothetical protein
MRGGQPSTTQPIAGPWLSPKVVNRNSRPKVLQDIRGLVGRGGLERRAMRRLWPLAAGNGKLRRVRGLSGAPGQGRDRQPGRILAAPRQTG